MFLSVSVGRLKISDNFLPSGSLPLTLREKDFGEKLKLYEEFSEKETSVKSPAGLFSTILVNVSYVVEGFNGTDME
jgi:hypothetical protein|tara:strand:+ start:151 stop:378 length:228 start_codon:yes stop_codon:yes gene_type:complete